MVVWEGVALDGIAEGCKTVRQPEPFGRILLARHRSLSESLVRRNRRHRAGSPVCRPSLIGPDQTGPGGDESLPRLARSRHPQLRWFSHRFPLVHPGAQVVAPHDGAITPRTQKVTFSLNV